MLCYFTGKPNLMGVTGGQLPPFRPHGRHGRHGRHAASSRQSGLPLSPSPSPDPHVQEAPRDLHGYGHQDPDGTLR